MATIQVPASSSTPQGIRLLLRKDAGAKTQVPRLASEASLNGD
jgi:hypothetical protein